MALTAIDPSTGKQIHSMPCDSAQQCAEKIAQAESAFHTWRYLSFEKRAEILNKVAAYLRAHKQTLGLHMTEEMGKPVKEADGEIEKSAWCAEHYATHAASYLEDEIVESDASRSFVRYQALGPILGILPWNAPFWLAFRFCAPTLMAGNTCLLKHDPHVPHCAQAIIEAFAAAGAPAGVIQALYLETPDVAAVIRDRHIQAVSFTGSSSGGAKVAALAAADIKPAVLELGGSDPCVVLKSADLKKACKAITLSRIINAGQSCIAAKRIIVEAAIYDQVIALLRENLAALKVGDPRSSETDIGPLARNDLRENLQRQVSASIASGARCLLGGSIPEGNGFYYPATLLVDVLPEHCVYREETFGPVAAVIKADDQAHALYLANDTDYGLAASVWGDSKEAERLGLQINAGQIVINGVVKTDPRLPSGGIKRSGYGRELGRHGIHAFTNAQQVWIG